MSGLFCFLYFEIYGTNLSLFTPSSSGGGGGGSGGAVSFSACTLTAGSSAKIEAKGGTGGQARSYGTSLLCRVWLAMLAISLILINLINK